MEGRSSHEEAQRDGLELEVHAVQVARTGKPMESAVAALQEPAGTSGHKRPPGKPQVSRRGLAALTFRVESPSSLEGSQRPQKDLSGLLHVKSASDVRNEASEAAQSGFSGTYSKGGPSNENSLLGESSSGNAAPLPEARNSFPGFRARDAVDADGPTAHGPHGRTRLMHQSKRELGGHSNAPPGDGVGAEWSQPLSDGSGDGPDVEETAWQDPAEAARANSFVLQITSMEHGVSSSRSEMLQVEHPVGQQASESTMQASASRAVPWQLTVSHETPEQSQTSLGTRGQRSLGSLASQPSVALDLQFIVEAAGAKSPAEVETLDLTGRNLASVRKRGLPQLLSLKELRVGENALPDLACLAPMYCLERLSAPLNMMTTVGRLPDDAFLRLTLLDVSYNLLTAKDVVALSELPSLSQLDVSGNSLGALPASLGPFRALRRLVAVRCDLTATCFHPLSALACLEQLFLCDNNIDHVPHDLSPATAFQKLTTVDLSSNLLKSEDDAEPLSRMPLVQAIYLQGNPMRQRHTRARLGSGVADRLQFRVTPPATPPIGKPGLGPARKPTGSRAGRLGLLPTPDTHDPLLGVGASTGDRVGANSTAAPAQPPHARGGHASKRHAKQRAQRMMAGVFKDTILGEGGVARLDKDTEPHKAAALAALGAAAPGGAPAAHSKVLAAFQRARESVQAQGVRAGASGISLGGEVSLSGTSPPGTGRGTSSQMPMSKYRGTDSASMRDGGYRTGGGGGDATSSSAGPAAWETGHLSSALSFDEGDDDGEDELDEALRGVRRADTRQVITPLASGAAEQAGSSDRSGPVNLPDLGAVATTPSQIGLAKAASQRKGAEPTPSALAVARRGSARIELRSTSGALLPLGGSTGPDIWTRRPSPPWAGSGHIRHAIAWADDPTSALAQALGDRVHVPRVRDANQALIGALKRPQLWRTQALKTGVPPPTPPEVRDARAAAAAAAGPAHYTGATRVVMEAEALLQSCRAHLLEAAAQGHAAERAGDRLDAVLFGKSPSPKKRASQDVFPEAQEEQEAQEAPGGPRSTMASDAAGWTLHSLPSRDIEQPLRTLASIPLSEV